MKKLFTVILLIFICLPAFSQSNRAPTGLDFNSFTDIPAYRDKFAGTWAVENAPDKRVYKFLANGTGSTSYNNSSDQVITFNYRYKITDSQVILYMTHNRYTNSAYYHFTDDETLQLTRWNNGGDRILKKIADDKTSSARASRQTASNSEKTGGGEESDSESADEPRFNISGAFSYYPPDPRNKTPHYANIAADEEDSPGAAPGTFLKNHSLNLSLQMGLNIYKSLSAYVDFGFNNEEGKNVKDALNLMAKINAKKFTLQLDYRIIKSEFNFWTMPGENYGYYGSWAENAIEKGEPDITEDFSRTWMTTALMYNSAILNFAGTYFGLLYFSGDAPAYITVDAPSGASHGDYVFLTTMPVWAVGIRWGAGWDHNYGGGGRFRPGSPFGSSFKILLDVAMGKGKQDQDLMKEIEAVGGKGSGYDDDGIFYFRMLGSLGLYFEQEYGNNKSWVVGAGLEVNMASVGFSAKKFESVDVGVGFGYYFNIGFKF